MVNEDLLSLCDDAALDKLFLTACPRCGAIGQVRLERNGQHIQAKCSLDSKHITFVKQKLSPEERAKWDSLKQSRGNK